MLRRPALSSFGRTTGLVLLVLGAAARPAPARPAVGAEIEIWVRRDSSRDSAKPRRLRLDAGPLTDVERYDAQYGQRLEYRGLSLGKTLERFSRNEPVDVAILHFANGMAIPLPFRDTDAMKRLDPFIARASRERPGKRMAIGKFPPIPKKDTPNDRRAIDFSGNKLVVADRWHPDVLPADSSEFSPWAHADTLVGIELVAREPYYAQFDVGGDATTCRGLALYRQNCQFCHGVRSVGATFGWDFVASRRFDNYRDSAPHLYHNVAFKPRNAAELGLMMPPFAFLREDDAAAIQRWLQAVAGGPTLPYHLPSAENAPDIPAPSGPRCLRQP